MSQVQSNSTDNKLHKKSTKFIKRFVNHWSNHCHKWSNKDSNSKYNDNNNFAPKCDEYIEILCYWFAATPADIHKQNTKQHVTFSDIDNVWTKKWFAKNANQQITDSHVTKNFQNLIIQASNNKLNHWLDNDDPFGRLCLIILLDQFPRNCFRNNAKSYQFDAIALKLCLDGIDKKLDLKLPIYFRLQYYLPLVHCEDRKIQQLCVGYYNGMEMLVDKNEKLTCYLLDIVKRFVKISKLHQNHIETFGRFPERNQVLKRLSSDQEKIFLKNAQQNTRCNNEIEFLCKVLTMIYGSLSNKSTTIIKNKAVKIADSQPIETLLSSQVPSCSSVKTVNGNNINDNETPSTDVTTVYKYVENKYNNSLSNLNSDVIDYVGTFLTKTESISFGYLNKQLYIETQKLSYLLKRYKDSDKSSPFVLNQQRIKELLLSPLSSPYSYSFPLHLTLTDFGGGDTNFWKKISKQDFFNNFFVRLNYLSCSSLELLKYIPINLVFNNKGNFYDSDESREYIKEFSTVASFNGDDENSDDDNKNSSDLDEFCQNLREYKMKNGTQMRKIQQLRFDTNRRTSGWGMPSIDLDWTIPDKMKRLFLLCCSMSESIIIECNIGRLGINNLNELEEMFHPKLKRFCFEKGKFECNINTDEGEDEYKQQNELQVGMLEEIEMTYAVFNSWRAMEWESVNDSFFHVFNFFDKLKMRRNIKRYILNWKTYENPDKRDKLLNKLFFEDCEKHPLLERIIFKVDNCDSLATVIEYFIQHKKELFVNKQVKLKLKHFQAIELQIDAANGFLTNLDFSYIRPKDFGTLEEFGIDEYTIKISNVGQSIQFIQQCIIDWTSRIKQDLKGRKVVLVV